MNCKPGDLAVGVRTSPEKTANLGCLLRVIRLYPGNHKCWEVETLSWSDRNGVREPPGQFRKAYDAYMRPLRDIGGVDEILRLAGLPVATLQDA